jgi:octaprenyl-diphosphate synthase
MHDLHKTLTPDLKKLDDVILSFLKEPDVPLIEDISRHLILAGGKRIRPLLLFLCARLYQETVSERVLRLGACLEFIHTATLLHDDVVDESLERRGEPAAQVLWGNQASVLVGDFLFSRAFELMVHDGSLDVFKVLSHAASQISRGELLQLSTIRMLQLSEEKYLEIIGAKTASLFSAAAELGAIAAGAPEKDRDCLKSFGHTLGLLFQIKDDLLDFTKDPKQTGKTPGNDLKEGKMTLPLILAYKHGSASNQSLIEKTLQNPELFEENFPKIQSLLQETNVAALIKSFIDPLYQKALLSLENLSSKDTAPLKEILQVSNCAS